MKILYKNKTKYTKEVYSKYLQFHQNKFGNKYTFSTVVTILLLCFCIITNLQYYHKSVAFILLITLIIFCFYRFYHPIKLVKQELKTEKFKNEIEFAFKFYNKFFTIFDSKNLEKVQYWKLHRIYETKDFFYLYIDKNHAFLLDKNTFTRGDTSEFLKFIKRKIWFKI
jgi:Ca2+/Na+ antiporter